MTAALGAQSTVDEVLRSGSLHNARVLVTGVSAGVGLEIARALACHDVKVVGAARDVGRAQAALARAGISMSASSRIRFVELDLASLASVRACSDRLLEQGEQFDAVIANAGVMAVPEGRTVDGFETHFATNYLGHFVLANRIASLFRSGSRLVMVSSAGHRGADVDLDDPSFERTRYDPLVAYRRSKTATILMAVEFDRRNRGRGIRATATHPGAVLTDTTRKLIEAEPAAASAFTWKTVGQGAATPVWAGLVAPAAEVGARYCEDCQVSEIIDDPASSDGVRAYALDPDHATALWIKSEEMVSENF